MVVGRRSDASLYDIGLATYGPEDAFDHQHADGFIRLWGMPLKVWSARQGRRLANPILPTRRPASRCGAVGSTRLRLRRPRRCHGACPSTFVWPRRMLNPPLRM